MKNLKELVKFINDGAEGRIKNPSEEEGLILDDEAMEILAKQSDNVLMEISSKIANMNILNLNIHFFDYLPSIWGIIQRAAEVSLKAEA